MKPKESQRKRRKKGKVGDRADSLLHCSRSLDVLNNKLYLRPYFEKISSDATGWAKVTQKPKQAYMYILLWQSTRNQRFLYDNVFEDEIVENKYIYFSTIYFVVQSS